MTRAILTDIEGTTSSIAFVHEVLFPYARAHIAAFCQENADDPQVAGLLADARALAAADGADLGMDLDATIAQLVAWIDADRKATPLKALQGLIWVKGYADGDFRGHVYDDAFDALTRWAADGVALYVYSSGSVTAQKLLFGHSRRGDMTPLFGGYFDTRVGHKREADSYRAIAAQIDLPPGEILFLSDVRAELDAAAAAGMGTIWLVRGEDPGPGDHPKVDTFAAIAL